MKPRVMDKSLKMQYIAFFVLISMFASIFAAFLPNGFFANADETTQIYKLSGENGLYALGKLSGTAVMGTSEQSIEFQTGGAPSGQPIRYTAYTSSAGTPYGGGDYYVLNGRSDTQHRITAELPIEKTGSYNLYYYIPHEQGIDNLEISVTDTTGTAKITGFSTKRAAGTWVQIGDKPFSFEQGIDAKVEFYSTATGGNFRMDALKIVDSSIAPSPEASALSSPIPSVSPSPAPIVTYTENFDAAGLGQYALGAEKGDGTKWWTDKETESDSATIASRKLDDHLLSFLPTENKAALNSPSLVNLEGISAAGKNVALSVDFRVKALPKSFMFIARNASEVAIIHIDIDPKDDNTFQISTREKQNGEKIPWSQGLLNINEWYTLFITCADNGAYNAYFLDEQKNIVLKKEGIAYKGVAEGTAGNLNYFQLNEFQVGNSIELDNIYIGNDPKYELPDGISWPTEIAPDVSMAPTSTPDTAKEKIYDNGDSSGNTSVTYIIPDGVEDSNTVFGTSSTGNVSENGTHGYADRVNSAAVYTLKNTGTGKYKVSIKIPLVHENNTDNMYVSVMDSLGKIERKTIDIRDIGGGTSKTGVKTGDWIEIGTDFVFYNSKSPTVTFGLDELGNPTGEFSDKGEPLYEHSGNYRFDGVKIERVGEVESYIPFVQNVNITGNLNAGETLTASYDFKHDNGGKEGATEIKWYTKASAEAVYQLVKEAVVTDADSLKYILKENDWFVKVEITPKDSAGIAGPTEMAELRSSLPIANKVSINGRLRPGAELTASYNYEHVDGRAEKDSVYTWYAKAKETDEYQVVAQGTTTSEQGAKYLTKAGQRFIKFEITPKCDSSVAELAAGEPVSAEFDLVYEKDSAPVATEVKIIGEPIINAILTANYQYTDNNGDVEQTSSYRWLASSSLSNDDWRVLTSGTATAADEIKYKIPEDFPLGDYIRFEITPNSDSNDVKTGQATVSDAIGPVTIGDLNPQAKDVHLGGQVVGAEGVEGLAIEGVAEISYTYTDPSGTIEGNSLYQWYVSDNAYNNFEPIEGANTVNYTPDEGMQGKFIKASVIPYNSSGSSGNAVETEALQVKYRLAFNDDFDYNAADGNDEEFGKLWYSDKSQRETGGIKMARIPENVKTEDGKLIIMNRKEHNSNYAFDHTWTTGSINSRPSVGPYGYYEAKYKYAYATGMNQSFWASGGENGYHGADGEQFIELDFNEGHFPRELKSNLHYFDTAGTRIQNSVGSYPIGKHDYNLIEAPTLGDDFHVYGSFFKPNDPTAPWKPDNANETNINSDTFQVFFDDSLVRSTCSIPYDKVKKVTIRLSIAIYPGFGGPLYDETQGPNKITADGTQMEVDYVRYYELLDVASEALNNTIVYAQSVLDRTEIGNGFGECPKIEYATALEEVISAGKSMLNQPEITKEQKERQITAINDAIGELRRNINYKGTLVQDGIYDLTDEGITNAIEMTIPSSVTNVTIQLPKTARNQIQIHRASQDGKTIDIVINRGTEIGGTFTIPDFSSLTLDGKDVLYRVSSCGIYAENSLIQIKLPQASSFYVGAYENAILNQITNEIDKNTMNAAMAAIGTGNEVLCYKDYDAYVWAKRPTGYVVYRDAVTPTPTPSYIPNPTPQNDGGNSSSGYPGGIIKLPETSPSPEVRFADIAGHWAEEEIRNLAKQGVIKGKSETIFAPDDTMTRAEFAALIRRALGINPAIYEGAFEDIRGDVWYANEVQAIINAGIMTGDTDGAFRPDSLISRQEMAKVMVNAYLYKTGVSDVSPAALSFHDTEMISGWAKEYVGKAVALGLINGMDSGSFEPEGYTTRAQGAAVIARLIQ